MNRTRRSIVVALPLAVASMQADVVDDGLLHDRVNRKLNNKPTLRIRDLKVDVKNGTVTIEGVVRSEKVKARAAKVASVKGVDKVVNRLVVGN